MMRAFLTALVLLTVFGGTALIAAPKKPVPKPPSKPGAIILFGDSTTAPRGALKVYSRLVQEALKKDGSDLEVSNAGVGGNTTRDAKLRFERDVLKHQPRLVVMQFGINDSAVDVWKEPPVKTPRVPVGEFEHNLREMILQLRETGAAVILMTANPLRWNDGLKKMYGHPPYDVMDPLGFEKLHLLSYNATVRKVADDLKVPLVDIHAAYDEAAAAGKPAESFLLDGVHPNNEGQALVAEKLMPVMREVLKTKAK